MKLGYGLIFAAVSLLVGCADTAGDDPIVIQQECTTNCGNRGKSDDVGPPESVLGPTVVCGILKGTDTEEFIRQDSLECIASSEPGFALQWASVRSSSPQQVEEGRVEQTDTIVYPASFVGDKYPMDVTITVQFTTDAVTPSNGNLILKSDSVTCEGQLASPDDTIECGKSLERWGLEIVPDAALQAAWDAGEYRALFYDLRITPLSGESGTARWDYASRKGEDLAQSLILLLDPAANEVTLHSKPYQAETTPVKLLGPGRYELHTDGTLSLGAVGVP